MTFSLETPEMLQAILSSIDEGIHVIDADGKTIYYNKVIAALDGLTEDEVIGQHVLDSFPSLDMHTSTFLQVLGNGKPLMNQPQTYVNVKGMRVNTINSTLPIYVEGRMVGAVEVAKDISKMKELAERFVDLQARLVAHEKAKVPKNKHSEWYELDHFLTQDPLMLNVKKAVLKVAQSTSPVLVYGETGTGKEIIAQALHSASPRKKGPFIAQNCAALPESLLESLLFGTTKGSFTGSTDRKGLFEIANGGTLFLDELNSMPVELQVKLLRVLQDGAIRRIGDHKMIPIDVRIVVAMNVDPHLAVQKGQLRSDLYYRIQVVSIYLSPLRERLQDIPLLIDHFVHIYASEFGKENVTLDSAVLEQMKLYSWPGNVRELEHAIEAAMNFAEGDILELTHFPEHLQKLWGEGMTEKGARDEQASFSSVKDHHILHVKSGMKLEDTTEETGAKALSQRNTSVITDQVPPLRETLEREEKRWMQQALLKTKGNVKQAADLLQIPRQTMQYKLKKYQLEVPVFRHNQME
ncbi:arginine utilization regulatory protein [Bacillus horti]|uniref:Arginine utilization regulatory protein n=2 Tax=Caldalkalibacillus horti TaxID=77523 RepID=A0ABT9VW45_9BACI|nr:arginine utilization regulatory protein [Bacillus horti]